MIEESELYRKLVDASTDGLWLLDGDGRSMLFNPRMAELLGRTPEQMEGLSAYDVHDEAGKAQFAAHLERAKAGDPGHNDLEIDVPAPRRHPDLAADQLPADPRR